MYYLSSIRNCRTFEYRAVLLIFSITINSSGLFSNEILSKKKVRPAGKLNNFAENLARFNLNNFAHVKHEILIYFFMVYLQSK
jgi:hypothetical protein